MAEQESMSEKLDRIALQIDDMKGKKKKKRFRLPWSVLLQRGKTKRDYAIVQLIRANGSVTFKMVKVEDNTIKIGDVYHDASANYIMRYKRYPLIIVPEWNIKPISNPETDNPKEQVFDAEKNLKEAIKDGSLTATEKFILTKIKSEQIKPKTQIKMKTILIILGVLAGAYFLLDYMQLL